MISFLYKHFTMYYIVYFKEALTFFFLRHHSFSSAGCGVLSSGRETKGQVNRAEVGWAGAANRHSSKRLYQNHSGCYSHEGVTKVSREAEKHLLSRVASGMEEKDQQVNFKHQARCTQLVLICMTLITCNRPLPNYGSQRAGQTFITNITSTY